MFSAEFLQADDRKLSEMHLSIDDHPFLPQERRVREPVVNMRSFKLSNQDHEVNDGHNENIKKKKEKNLMKSKMRHEFEPKKKA
ncbi:hypothetical protein RUM43_000540 [Polyplax serrata]|uniref:Uncharacterized protein n=1 Tax=Polyplax serrata TaxID=468196 RepID=A0AAN8XN98_POLSC